MDPINDQMAGSGVAFAIGAAVKHLLPWGGVNKFIPLIGALGAGTYRAITTGAATPETIALSAVRGVFDAMTAKGSHGVLVDHTPLKHVQIARMRGGGTSQGL